MLCLFLRSQNLSYQIRLEECKTFRTYLMYKRTKGKKTLRRNHEGVCKIIYYDTALQFELQSIGEAITRKSPSAITLNDFRSGTGKCFILSCTIKNGAGGI